LLARPLEFESHVYHLFVLLSDERDRLATFLRERGVESVSHYPVPAHEQAGAKGLRRDSHGLYNAERHARECLSVPCHPNMSDVQVKTVIRVLNEFR